MALHDKAFYFSLFFILGLGITGWNINIWLGMIFVALVAKIVFSLRAKQVIALVAVVFLGVFYGALYDVVNSDRIPLGEKTDYLGIVSAEPEESIRSTLLEIELKDPHRGLVRLYTSPDRVFEYADTVSFSGEVDRSPTGRNIVSFPDKIEVLERTTTIKGTLFDIKDALVGNLKSALPSDEAALASGILFGEREDFSEEFEEAMRISGTTHIVALSGYNIAILVVIVFSAFSYLTGRRGAFYLSLLVIPIFVVMTGAEASVVRAAIMGLILLLAEYSGRLYSLRNAIVLTALAMLVVDPTLLVKDVGFQLSFAALLGIVYIHPWLEKQLKIFDQGLLNWKKVALQTFSAQIAVLPIVLLTFGFFSPLALVANILILEAIPITMLISFLVAVLGFVSGGLSLGLGWIARAFLEYEIFIINLFGLAWT